MTVPSSLLWSVVLIRPDRFLFVLRCLGTVEKSESLGRKCMHCLKKQKAPDAAKPEANHLQTHLALSEIYRCNYLKFLKELMSQ